MDSHFRGNDVRKGCFSCLNGRNHRDKFIPDRPASAGTTSNSELEGAVLGLIIRLLVYFGQ